MPEVDDITRYKYLTFMHIDDAIHRKSAHKTSIWECRNRVSSEVIGMVKWFAPWRQYCFYPRSGTVFNHTCLNDISHFIGQLREHKILGVKEGK